MIDLCKEVQSLDLTYALSACTRVFEEHTTTFLFDTLGLRKDSEEEALQLTPSSITISEAIYALDTSNPICSSRCAESEVVDETEAPPAVTMSEASVLAQA